MTFEDFVKAISVILYVVDPIGLSIMGCPHDEYDLDAYEIAILLCKKSQVEFDAYEMAISPRKRSEVEIVGIDASEDEVRKIVHATFVADFYPAKIAGEETDACYGEAAKEIKEMFRPRA